MKIKIKNRIESSKKILILVPNFLIKSRLIWKVVIKNSEEEIKEELLKIMPVILKGYKTLKKVIKINGHFNLVEIESNEVYITIRL